MNIAKFTRFLTVFGLLAMLPASAMAAGWPVLTPPPSAPVAVPSLDIMTLLRSAPNTGAYQRFSYNGYSFEIPRNWKPEIVTTGGEGDRNEVVFKNQQGHKAANLQCPALGFGLEFTDTDVWEKKINKNGFLYNIELTVGRPEGQKTPTFAFIIMSHIGYMTQTGSDSDPGSGCILNVEKTSNLTGVAKRIYRSVNVEDWKMGLGAGLRFRYPAAWTLKTADISPTWKHGIFTDVNGREVANFDCPIPGQGFIGYDLMINQRSLSKPNGNYTIKRMSGTSSDEQDGPTRFIDFIGWTKPESPSLDSADLYRYSCQIISNKDGQKGFFREIYKSLK